ncbi:MAG: ABC transporter substrate-binding protein [Desulfobacteraceae bacterium]|nr:ABC transporter substrate-binding protein [Desulfobacteraceae bacterium]
MNFKSRVDYKAVFVFFVSFLLLFSALSWAENTPRLNNGKKWRIGYYEGGPYSDYTDTMRTFVKGLIELGWIQETPPPELFSDIPKPYWKWLAECDSKFLSFQAEDGYSASWDEQKRSTIRSALLEKLKANTLDLVIAMGTWAGQDLANNEHAIPTLVMSTSDPIKAGIINSAGSSGLEHVTARVDPGRYLRQIRMFHRIAGFQKLGIAYEDTPDGLLYSAVSEVHRIAEERGFDVITCHVIDSTADTELSDRSCMDCYRQLVEKAEAVYVTALTCVDRQVKALADLFKAAGVPSFSLVGSKYVRKGLLLSISSDSGYTELGRYNAGKFGEILNGKKPISLEQVFEDPLAIAVNIKTAREIGIEIPKSILRIAAEKYE